MNQELKLLMEYQWNCPLMTDRCDQRNVIYQADVYAVGNKKMSYYGLTENEFKKRCSTHKSLFRTTLKQSYRSSFVFWGDFVLGDFVPTTNLPYSMYTITVNTHIDQVLYWGGGHCVFKWILRGHLKPTTNATI